MVKLPAESASARYGSESGSSTASTSAAIAARLPVQSTTVAAQRGVGNRRSRGEDDQLPLFHPVLPQIQQYERAK